MSQDESDVGRAIDGTQSGAGADRVPGSSAGRVANAMAVILAGAVILLLARPAWVEIPGLVPRATIERIQPMLVHLAAVGAETCGGHDVTTKGGVVQVHNGSVVFALGGETLSAVIVRAPIFVCVLGCIAVAFWRTRGLGLAAGSVLVLLTLALAGPLLIVLDAALQGAAAGFAHRSWAEFAWGMAKAIPPGFACVALAGVWWAITWARGESDAQVAPADDLMRVRPPSLCAATSAVSLTTIFWAMAALAGLVAGEGRMAARYGIGMFCAASAVVLLAWSLVRRSWAARWAWLPMALMVPLGSEMGGAAALLLTIVASRDERLSAWAGKPMTEGARDRVRQRVERPLWPWIWLLAAVAALGAALRMDPRPWGTQRSVPAHPVVFALAAVTAALLAVGELLALKRRGDRRWRWSATAGVVPMLCIVMYVAGWIPGAQAEARAAAERIRMRAAAERIPMVVGNWTGAPLGEPLAQGPAPSAQAVMYRRYTERTSGRTAELVVICVQDARDARSHDLRRLCTSGGWTLSAEKPTTWRIGGRKMPGMEYEFAYGGRNGMRMYVAQLIAASDGTAAAGGKDAAIREGLTQVQVTMDGSAPSEQRAATVAALMDACAPVIEARWGGEPAGTGRAK